MAGTTTDRRQGITSSVAIKVPCKAGTTANITLSGEQTIDGIACVTDDRVLVKNQTDASENGIYYVNTSSWSRAPDWDGSLDIKQGTMVRVNSGTQKNYYVVSTANPITIGTTEVEFAATDTDSVLREDLATTATDDGTKGFNLVYYPPRTGETGIVKHQFPYGNARRYGLGDGSTSFSTALQNAHDSLPSTGGEIVIPYFPGSVSHTVNDEVNITKDDVHLVIEKGVVLSLSTIDGTGTANVHNTADVISAFKVTGDRCKIELHGRITSGVTSYNSKNIVGILPYACADFELFGTGKIDSLYNAYWPCKACTNVKVRDIEISSCSHNQKWGSDEDVAVSPEVTGGEILNVHSHLSTNDGCKLAAYVFDVQVKGGEYDNNTRDAVDMFVAGERCAVVGIYSHDNGIKAVDAKYTTALTGTGAGQGGFNRRCAILDNWSVNDGTISFSVADDDDVGLEHYEISGCWSLFAGDDAFSVNGRNMTISGNHAIGPQGRCYDFRSLSYSSVIGNHGDKGCLGGVVTEGMAFGTSNSGGKCTGLYVAGNHMTGSGAASGQQVGYSVPDAGIENSKFIGNEAHDHNTSNWSVEASYTAGNVKFRDNIGLVSENHGSATDTTDANGNIAVTHGLSAAPTYTDVSIVGDNAYIAKVQAVNTTTITVLVKDDSGADVTATSVTVSWQAKTAVAA